MTSDGETVNNTVGNIHNVSQLIKKVNHSTIFAFFFLGQSSLKSHKLRDSAYFSEIIIV